MRRSLGRSRPCADETRSTIRAGPARCQQKIAQRLAFADQIAQRRLDARIAPTAQDTPEHPRAHLQHQKKVRAMPGDLLHSGGQMKLAIGGLSQSDIQIPGMG